MSHDLVCRSRIVSQFAFVPVTDSQRLKTSSSELLSQLIIVFCVAYRPIGIFYTSICDLLRSRIATFIVVPN